MFSVANLPNSANGTVVLFLVAPRMEARGTQNRRQKACEPEGSKNRREHLCRIYILSTLSSSMGYGYPRCINQRRSLSAGEVDTPAAGGDGTVVSHTICGEDMGLKIRMDPQLRRLVRRSDHHLMCAMKSCWSREAQRCLAFSFPTRLR